MAFGFANAPVWFNASVEKLIGSLPVDILKYFDDFLIQAETMEVLAAKLKEIVDKIHAAGFSISNKKIQIGTRVKFLGMIREGNKLLPDPEKIEALRMKSKVTNYKDLKRVLGLLRFFQGMSPEMAIVLQPFNKYTSLTNKRRWIWNDDLQKKLEKAIDKLIECMVRHVPDYKSKFYVHVDASDLGIAGCIFQIVDGVRYPIRFFSRPFHDNEYKWSSTQREAFATVQAAIICNKEHIYEFELWTDHKPLIWLFDQARAKDPPCMLARWVMFLQGFKFKVLHIPGKFNVVADPMTREPFMAKKTSNVPEVVNVFTNKVVDSKKEEVEEEEEFPPVKLDMQFEGDAFEIMARAMLLKETIPKPLDEPQFDEIKKLVLQHINKLELMNNRLVYRVDSHIHRINSGFRYYVPVVKRQEVLSIAHDAPSSGHLGITKTIDKLTDHVWWPSLREDVEYKVSTCSICQRSKHSTAIESELFPPEPDFVFGRVHMDLIIPLTTTVRGNKGILVLVDSASKYTILIPIANKEATTIARALVTNVFCTYGMMDVIVSDCGTEFVNNLAKEVNMMLGISTKTTVGYAPFQNGQVERKNSVIMNILRAISKPDHSDWDLMCPYAQFAINTYKPRGIMHSSFFLMYGREAITVLDIAVDAKPANVGKLYWWNALVKAREMAAVMEHRVRLRGKELHDSKLTNNKFDVGDLVLVKFFKHKTGFSSKLSPLQQGPYRIIKKDRSNVTIQHVEFDEILDVHVSRLFKYREGDNIEGDFEFEVDEIVEEKKSKGETLYRVRFKGYNADHDAWHTKEELHNALEVLEDWKKKQNEQIVPEKKIQSIVGHRKIKRSFIFKVICEDGIGPTFYEDIKRKDF